MDYKKAGVDVEKADLFVEKIKSLVPSTFNADVMDGIGGFAAVYRLDEQRYLASCTDGVGTKLKLAQKLGRHYGVGIDLVAMCVNDLLCVGARPLFFLDYMAFGKLNTQISEELIAGMVDGCKQSGMALIGGETAEMPGMYQDDEYDLAGFSVGEMAPAQMHNESTFSEGDVLLGLASSGFHSNGYSLLRQLVETTEVGLIEELLTPTRIYVSLFNKIKNKFPGALVAAAHITGGGVVNIPRMSPNFDYVISKWPSVEEVAPIFKKMTARMKLSTTELLNTFNMGIGMVLLVKKEQAQQVEMLLQQENEKYFSLGFIRKGHGQLQLK